MLGPPALCAATNRARRTEARRTVHDELRCHRCGGVLNLHLVVRENNSENNEIHSDMYLQQKQLTAPPTGGQHYKVTCCYSLLMESVTRVIGFFQLMVNIVHRQPSVPWGRAM